MDTSRRVATNDEYAEIMWKWESKPFGESKATGTQAFNLRFPGQYFDAETSTHYNINRDYNPVAGRYIQSDPIGFDGGVNGFGYVGGNPLTNIDREGLVDLNFIPDIGDITPESINAVGQQITDFYLRTEFYYFNDDNGFTVAAHGIQGMMYDWYGNRMGEGYLDYIASKAQSSGKNFIWLLSCYVGDGTRYYDGYSLSTPQYIANKSNMTVIATDGYVDMNIFGPSPRSGYWYHWLPR